MSQNVDLMYIFNSSKKILFVNPEITCIITLDWHRLLFQSLLFIFLNKYTSVKNNLNQYIWQKFEDFFHTFHLYAWWNFYLLLLCIEIWDDRECVFKTEKRGNFYIKKKFNFGTKLFLIIKFLRKKCLKRKPGTEYHQFKFCT